MATGGWNLGAAEPKLPQHVLCPFLQSLRGESPSPSWSQSHAWAAAGATGGQGRPSDHSQPSFNPLAGTRATLD